uniref:Tudor domain-containing protein n=1 Tax=Macrostomum lignano TaxID=282301 RepID=A0A1I8FJH7_9PLAT
MDPDRPFVPLPLQPSRYASIGLPPTSEPCPVEATDILDLPCVVSLQLLPLDSAGRSANERLASTCQSDLSAALCAAICTTGCRLRAPGSHRCLKAWIFVRLRGEILRGRRVYRAEVLLFKEDTMLVYFVDYGNAEYMSLARSECNLRQPLFLDEPCLAVRCRLQGLVRHPIATLDDLPTRKSLRSGDQLPRRYRSCS